MQDIDHPDLFWPALDRLIAGAPSTSRVAHELSCFLDREDAFKRLIEGSVRDEPDAAEWRKLCQRVRAMARRKLAHPAPYAARLLATDLGWEPRRINSAICYLQRAGIILDRTALASAPFNSFAQSPRSVSHAALNIPENCPSIGE